MRIKLKKGKQKELIILAKNNLNWEKLSEKIGIKENYLQRDLKNEKILIKEKTYNELCRIVNINFDKFILDKLNDFWGKSKGGLNSKGSTIQIKIPRNNEKLAELIGVILGDGNISKYQKGKKTGVYQINITGHKDLDEDYHTNYLFKIFQELFGLKPITVLSKNSKGRHLIISSKQLVNFFSKHGLKNGDKIKNQSTFPTWIWKKKNFLKACVRGLIDTDGSIFRMSQRDYNLIRINFTNHNLTLLKDTRKAFLNLGFNPSKIINNRQFYLSRQDEIRKYLKEIGFSNVRHQERLKSFSPIFQRSRKRDSGSRNPGSNPGGAIF
ncbi:MAG: hypothetical protein QJ16_C0016G0007 [archaeon GW2011_AR1]|nr:MAG: hypothetical protein QJ16_C0016G0007 [archaeon GW2011_AR1]